MWSPYPFQSPIFASNTYKIARFRGRLAELVNESATLSLGLRDSTPTKSTWDQGIEIYRKLLQWESELPPEILLERNSTPHSLCLRYVLLRRVHGTSILLTIFRMYYYTTTIALCDTFETHSATRPDEQSEFNLAGTKTQAVEALGSLILLYKHFHGFKSVPIVMLHYLCVGGINAIARLGPSDMKWMKVLESCALGLWNMAIGWGRLGKAFLKIIAFLIKARKVEKEHITPRTAAIMDQLDGAYWNATDAASLAADYVVPAVRSDLTPAATGLGLEVTARSVEDLIKAAEQLTL